MQAIYLVTGNQNKLRELTAIFPAEIKLAAKDLDLAEIQSLDSEEIVRDKLGRAYSKLQKPVIVEDVSAEMACLNGLPGPFVKYFVKRLGKSSLWKLAESADDKSVLIRCTMGYYDGTELRIVHGEVPGTVVSPGGEHGFGFDFVFMPAGKNRRISEMTPQEKNAMSWRARAAEKLVREIALLTH